MEEIVELLASLAVERMGPDLNDFERYCWMVVHEHRHGFVPTEYDIREIDEDLYTAVLNRIRKRNESCNY